MDSKPNITRNLIIFASGEGSNTEKIIDYFTDKPEIKISAVLSNKYNSPVLEKAHKRNIKAISFDRDSFFYSNEVFHLMKDLNPDLIVLAGFLWLMPERIVQHFSGKIINLHPALLPKHGGKGMYGNRVHKAVIANEEPESGITIHYVNENFDEGRVVEQFKTKVNAEDTHEGLAEKIKALEHKHYPEVIEKILKGGYGKK
jgi:phosphoribosylglycinamide formyltransferase-1